MRSLVQLESGVCQRSNNLFLEGFQALMIQDVFLGVVCNMSLGGRGSVGVLWD